MGQYDHKNGKGRSAAKPSALADRYDADFRGYINVLLSDADKASFEDWWATGEPFDTLEKAVSDGVNLALKIEVKSGAFLASATQRRASSPNAGLCVTARAKTAALAWGRLLFILSYLDIRERWEDTQPLADPSRW